MIFISSARGMAPFLSGTYIKLFPVCNPQYYKIKIIISLKQIIDEDPHYRYETDILKRKKSK